MQSRCTYRCQGSANITTLVILSISPNIRQTQIRIKSDSSQEQFHVGKKNKALSPQKLTNRAGKPQDFWWLLLFDNLFFTALRKLHPEIVWHYITRILKRKLNTGARSQGAGSVGHHWWDRLLRSLLAEAVPTPSSSLESQALIESANEVAKFHLMLKSKDKAQEEMATDQGVK